ncbi:cytochrome P450 CYP5280A1P [Xylariomycetidae sp. FL2044]|nr:cytochrome P450 CYP5280A1P [Xylariomycetidae sp. FL2044]
MSAPLIIAIAGLGLVLWTLGWPIVRYLLDPLGFRKYPSQNFFSGFTPLAYSWEMGRTHKLHRSRRLHELHQKKGPVVRLAPDWLSFSTSASVKAIYGQKAPLAKNDLYYALQRNGQNLVNITSKAYHSERRQLVSAAYGPKNWDQWDAKISSLAATLVAQMDALCTPKLAPGQARPAQADLRFDGNKWALLFALDCMGKIGISADFGFVAQGSDAFALLRPRRRRPAPGDDADDDDEPTHRTEEIIGAIESGRANNAAAAILVWDTARFPLLQRASGLVSPWFARAWRHGDRWRDFLTQLVVDRVRRFDAGEQLDDLVQPLLQNVRTGEVPNVSLAEKVAEMDQILTGAIDGIGSSLANTLYYLVKHPDALKRARAEVDEALGSDDESAVVAPWSKVRSLPYLKACVDEAQRLSPSVAGDLPRKTPPGTPYTVDGVVVPGGSVVSISAYTAQRDPDIFPDPEAYRPERWLGKGEDQLRRMLEVYIVFTMGSRMCMGKSVTVLVQLVYLATLLRRYEFALASPDWELDWSEFFNMWPGAVPLKIWRRGPVEVS